MRAGEAFYFSSVCLRKRVTGGYRLRAAHHDTTRSFLFGWLGSTCRRMRSRMADGRRVRAKPVWIVPSAPEPEVSTSACTSPTPDIELWVTSSGKPMRRPRSWRGWRTRPWIARLSGDDVASFDGRAWRGLVDIVHGGYPCQPFSIAGRKLGDKDPRHLWPHVARIVREVEPRFCFFEKRRRAFTLGVRASPR